MLIDLQNLEREFSLLIFVHSYASYFDVIGIEPTITREISASKRKSLYEWSDDVFPPHLNEIPPGDEVHPEVIFDKLGLREISWLIAKLIPGVVIPNECLEARGFQGNP